MLHLTPARRRAAFIWSRRIRNGFLTTLAVAALLLAVLALIARTQLIANVPSLVLAAGAPYGSLAALVGLVIAASCRRYVLSIFAAVVLLTTLAVQISWYYIEHPSEVSAYQEIRVLSSNLRYGLADPLFLVRLATESADAITVSELTPEAVQRFEQAGIDKTFPYSHLLPGPGPGGIGMWSRYPLTPLTVPRQAGVKMRAARMLIPGVRFDPLLASVHIISPVAGDANTVAEWRGGMAGAKMQLENFARNVGPAAVIIGGDYNSTPDMRQFRDLLTNGYDDAVDEAGAGFAPTFPSNTWYPPLITIDHVLTRNATASSIKTIEIPGSDHRALLVTVRIPDQ